MIITIYFVMMCIGNSCSRFPHLWDNQSEAEQKRDELISSLPAQMPSGAPIYFYVDKDYLTYAKR